MMTTNPSPTGRLNVSQPEVQYFPGDPRAKRATPPKPGTPLVELDFSELELRIAAADPTAANYLQPRR